ncbi:DUF4332 domain-containing protein [Cyanobacteria bacterium FACHB-471]|nr:DUF4332 domain-containing protein [Cyanobacteria bacterium FACHB-471]
MGTAQRTRHSTIQPADWNIAQLPGLSKEDCDRLAASGIHTTLQLLETIKTVPEKQALAAQIQIHIQHLNKWLALSDLARVPIVGCQYCGMLLHAGISSATQLAQMSLPRLHQQILKLHVSTLHNQDHCPSLDELANWIRQARSLNI